MTVASAITVLGGTFFTVLFLFGSIRNLIGMLRDIKGLTVKEILLESILISLFLFLGASLATMMVKIIFICFG